MVVALPPCTAPQNKVRPVGHKPAPHKSSPPIKRHRSSARLKKVVPLPTDSAAVQALLQADLSDGAACASACTANESESAITLYIEEIGHLKVLAPQEELQLLPRVKLGDRKARERLIQGCLPVVVQIAREFENRGLPLLDLVSEGNVGLLQAVEQFNPASGNTFARHSAQWIRHSIECALASLS